VREDLADGDRRLLVRELGRVEYGDGLALMGALRQARVQDQIEDTLLLLEHPAVITLGRKGKRENLRVDEDTLARRGIFVVDTDRGGDITYHGPGQLVAYPVVSLAPDRCDVRRYVRDLEEAMIRTAAVYGVTAGRVEGMNGIWLGADALPPSDGPSRKLGAVGVHISRWVTSHGLAFNVGTALEDFDLIVPCGIEDRAVTSLVREIGRPVAVEEVGQKLAAQLAILLARQPVRVAAETGTVQVQVVKRTPDGVRLLALHRHEELGGFWQPVTGKIERGESAAGAAARELLEETGLREEPKPLSYAHAFLWPSNGVPAVAEETAFVAFAPDRFSPQLSALEHDEARWIAAAEADALFPHAGLRRGARLACELLPR
jgi:lipoyl(octanoyl) transferase